MPALSSFSFTEEPNAHTEGGCGPLRNKRLGDALQYRAPKLPGATYLANSGPIQYGHSMSESIEAWPDLVSLSLFGLLGYFIASNVLQCSLSINFVGPFSGPSRLLCQSLRFEALLRSLWAKQNPPSSVVHCVWWISNEYFYRLREPQMAGKIKL